MKIRLLCVGKLRSAPLAALCAEYLARLRRYGPCEVRECRPAQTRERSAAMAEESKRLSDALAPGEVVWVLDERGRPCTSAGLAERLSTLENRAVKSLAVVLGGAYGLDGAVRGRGELLSLSALTFPHELARLIVLEQLYRARTIQRGEPYHH